MARALAVCAWIIALTIPVTAFAQAADVATETASSDVDLLILSGGKTEKAARKALKSFPHFFIKPIEGYPRIVKSDTIEGLNPGFQIVVYGACPASEESVVLDLTHTRNEGSYIKKVRWSGLPPCPRLPATAKVKKLETKPTKLGYLAASDVNLSGKWFVLVKAYNKKGKRIGMKSMDSNESTKDMDMHACSNSDLKAANNKLELYIHCMRPDCTIAAQQHGMYQFELRQNRLSVDLSKEELIPGECDD